jgi:hypothetical protein
MTGQRGHLPTLSDLSVRDWSMKKTFAFILVLCAVAVGYYVTSTNPNSLAGRQKNVEYMRDRLGKIVMEYSEKHKSIPEGFEIALNDSDKTLPNRGDYFGRSMVYQKLSDDSFRFVAFGQNGEYDDGKSDDVVVKYADGTWSDNAESDR